MQMNKQAAIVTGGASGLGAETARRLLAAEIGGAALTRSTRIPRVCPNEKEESNA